MSRSDRSRISVVADDTIVIDDLVGLAVLDGADPDHPVVWANDALGVQLGLPEPPEPGDRLTEHVDDPHVADALTDLAGHDERTVRVAVQGRATLLVQVSATGGTDADTSAPIVVVARPVHTTPRAALYDAVTGLASLALFREHLDLGIRRRARDGHDLAVVVIEVADFAGVWQQRGDSAALLQTRIAERVERVARESDVLASRRPGSLLLLVIDPRDAVAAATLACERMLEAFTTPLVLAGGLQPVDLQIGIGATLPDDDPETAVARADAALADAAAAGTNVYRVRLGDAS